jgi:hypothetical protein
MFRVCCLALFAAWVYSASAGAQEPAVEYKFKFSMSTRGEKPGELDSDVSFTYRHQRSKNDLTILLDGVSLKVQLGDELQTEVRMSREGIYQKEKNKATTDIKLADAPPKLKQLLEESFGAPICQIQLDPSGKELKRAIVAGPAAKSLIENGMIANLRFLHPPPPANEARWTHANAVSVGQGRLAEGPLTYEKTKQDGGKVTVAVNGTLASEWGDARLPDFKAHARYVLTGEQVYDQQLREWVSASLSGKVIINTSVKDEKKFSKTGDMRITLELLRP